MADASLDPPALRLPEILDRVLMLASQSTQATSAQICQTWSVISLKWLWRDLESVFPLLLILSPLVLNNDRQWVSSCQERSTKAHC